MKRGFLDRSFPAKLIATLSAALLLCPTLLSSTATAQRAADFDVVLANGRVMDPESNMDAVRHVGIRKGKIAAISTRPLRGQTVIDASGLVIAPGFIDLHAHGVNEENNRYQARDGVTTALELEVGVSPVAAWYQAREGKSLINFGATVGHIPVKMAVMKDTGTLLPRDHAKDRVATIDEVRQVADLIRKGLDEGGLGIGFGINYVPTTSRAEIFDLFAIAAERGVANYVHVRNAGAIEPGSGVGGVQEVLAAAAATGASLHVVHITSMCLRQTPTCLQMIAGAARRGIDVTTEFYPYTATQTRLESALYNDGWQEAFGITYKDLQWVATGERLTAESFARYRREGGSVIGHAIPEDISRLAAATPGVIVASDGSITNGKGHPRGAGTFARVLGRYVREQKALSLMEAIRKMTLLPAQRLEKAVPAMRAKGRVKVGADADLTIFDPMTVIDRATFENPAQYSEGIRHVLVGGAFVVRDEKIDEGVRPGHAIRREPTAESRIEEFARKYAAAWSSKDPASVASFFAVKGSLTVNNGKAAVGRAAITGVARAFMTDFPDMVVTMDRIVQKGGITEFHWTLTGTNTGPDGKGNRVRISGFEAWRIGANGLIVESKGHFDAAEYKRQIDGKD